MALLHRGTFATALVLAALCLALAGAAAYQGSPMRSETHPRSMENAPGRVVDVLRDGDLRSTAGTRVAREGLQVVHRGFAIVRQDGSGGRANPPWNLYGSRVQVRDDFAVSLTLKHLRGEAAMLLASRPPIVYDEFRNDRGSVRIAVEGRSVWIGVVSPASRQRLVTERQWRRPGSGPARVHLQVRRTDLGDRLTVTVDGRKLGQVPLSHALSGDQLWFGFDAADPGGSFLVSEVKVGGPEGTVQDRDLSPLTVPDLPGDGLDELAGDRRPGFRIGTALSLASLASDQDFAQLALGGDFGSMTTENALKAQFVHPLPRVFDFHDADALVDIATRNGLAVHGHALVFGEANPRWMQSMAARHPQRMRGMMRQHVRTVVSRYAGKVASWDVVNEPLADYGAAHGRFGLRRSIWLRSIGPEYVAAALRAAHAADPTAKLFINEYGLEAHDGRWRTFRRLLVYLQRQGVPLDGVGLQTHVYEPGDDIDPARLRATIDDLASLGLQTRISELDVYGADPSQQAAQFAAVLRTCVAAPTCVSLTTWGVSERYSSTSYLERGRLVIGDGLPWDRHLRPLPAVAAMRAVLLARP